jgi:hypothetical protein
MPTLETSTAAFIRLADQADDPATPASGYAAFYSKGDSPYFKNDAGTETALAGGTGDVVGPASAVADAVVLFDSTTGKLIKDSGLKLAAGTYTPSLTNVANVAASTAYLCQYLRVGNIVTVAGAVTIDATTTGTTQLGMSLPVASNFANNYELGGVARSPTTDTARILADTTNDRANIYFTCADTASLLWSFTFTYLVI